MFPPSILPTIGIRAVGVRPGRVQFDPVSKVFLMVISGKRLRMLPLEGYCINVVEEGLTLEGEIVRYSNVSQSLTLGRNEKVEQHIRKKTRKPNP